MELKTCKKICHGPLARGCELCVKGEKSVIFVTGICHYKCFYCPISDDKRGEDIVKVNEHIITNPDEEEGLQQLFSEIENCQSTGASLTGGDPLASLDRSIKYIKALKQKFGKDFHIHLYTSLPFVTQEAIMKLESAGLDEIRFHADMEDIDSWVKLLFAEDLSIDVGVEIPVVPGMKEKIKEFIHFCKNTGFIQFMNFNELEYSDVSETKLIDKGFLVKDLLSYGIRNSEELAKELVEFGESIGMRTHYCSASFKDGIQLSNRLRLRSEKVAKEYDLTDEEGMLTRGEIKALDGKNIDLEIIKLELQEDFDIPEELMDNTGTRLLIASWVLREILPELRNPEDGEIIRSWLDDVELSVVKEYPTDDSFQVEREIL
ncbi:MAG: radical SAM protein [Patescibacteria group bacterium]|nr:radical SAM protein [Patescibacteria group bacterium]